jgi:hypothetical protein
MSSQSISEILKKKNSKETLYKFIEKNIDDFVNVLSSQYSIDKDRLVNILQNEIKSKKTSIDFDKLFSSNSNILPGVEKSDGKCQYIFTKGAKEGQKCTSGASNGSFCAKHSKKDETIDDTKTPHPTPVLSCSKTQNATSTLNISEKPNEDKSDGKCQYVFSKGDKQGQKCTSKSLTGMFCGKHTKKEEEPSKSEIKETDKPKPKSNTKTKVDKEQKDNDVINRLVTEKVVKKSEPFFCARRNAWKNYEHEETGLVFDWKTEEVIGKQNQNGNIDELSVEDIELCKEYGFKYKLPGKLIFSNKEEKQPEEDDIDLEEIEDEEFVEEEDEEDYE